MAAGDTEDLEPAAPEEVGTGESGPAAPERGRDGAGLASPGEDKGDLPAAGDKVGQLAVQAGGVLAEAAAAECSPPRGCDDRYHLFAECNDYTWQITCPRNY